MPPTATARADAPELWAGPAPDIVRIGERYVDQIAWSGFAARLDADLERLAGLGVARVRLPLAWERIAPDVPGERDWREADRAMQALRAMDLAPVAGLLHHGSGPRYTGLLDAGFAAGLAAHARAVAERFPDIAAWAPLAAPVATARLSALHGQWYPQHQSDASFVRALLSQVRATVLAMRAVRAVNPAAVLVQSEDIGLTQSALRLRYHAEFMNLRRWLAFDLLCGRVDRSHRLWRYLRKHGAGEAELMAFVEAPCPPEVLGVDLREDSDRFLDERLVLYPREQWSGNGRHRFIDHDAVGVQGEPVGGFEARLREAWQRYRCPLAVTETQGPGPREEQMRWLHAAWQAALVLRREGMDVRAVTAPAAFGVHDWRSLAAGDAPPRYAPGLWDVRANEPRPTALAAMARGYARQGRFEHPVLEGPGRWQREGRFTHPPHGRVRSLPAAGRPLLVAGGTGRLGQAFGRVCEGRGLAHRLLERSELDIAEPAAIAAAFERWNPWAVINAAGFVRVDEAEHAPQQWRDNALAPATLAAACARAGVRLVSFSSAQVFDGHKDAPYVEADAPRPLNAYGRAKLEAERGILAADPAALVIRTAALFGPWDAGNLVARAVAALRQRRRFAAAMDHTLSPTYLPHLVHAALDLLLDGMAGVLHLANRGAVSAAEFARMAAHAAGLDEALVDAVPAQRLGLLAPRPAQAALASERVRLMPTLDEALADFVREAGVAAAAPEPPAAPRRRAAAAAR
jgi:dTDP-4-dehydrorhamnose reductase